ncbi:MAG: L,D-transpeptidase [Candidatus Algichlamydia australiensis]|nr:L,D-transpeptidase [Chlamydiales bacterium]
MKRFLIFGTVCLFAGIGAMGWLKKKNAKEADSSATVQVLEDYEPLYVETKEPVVASTRVDLTPQSDDIESVDQIYRLFTVSSSRYPFVETITYTPRVDWLKGRAAWISDYASYFHTSKHFIARSLNGKPDYYAQKVKSGDRFNVFKPDCELTFHLVVDLSRCKMWFYAVDLDANKRYLMKTYVVGVGSLEPTSPSGTLTPTGKYLLGDKISVHKPGTMGLFKDEESELIQVFGTRWIPFGAEIENCSHPYKGYGIHGTPWLLDEKSGELIEDRTMVGNYNGDGCIHLLKEDIEELYAIVVTKPTIVEIVKDYRDANVPGED